MDFITELRKPKIQIVDGLELSIFDVSASYLGVYFISKYIFNISRPGLTSAIIFMPISYFAMNISKYQLHLTTISMGKLEINQMLI